MTEGPDITVVIPAHNAVDTLQQQLDAVLAQQVDADFEVIVVDNNSTDATAALVRATAAADPRVHLVASSAGAGPSHARNVGIAHARSEMIACCDADDVVAVGWLAAMHAALLRHRAVSGVLEVDSLNEPDVVAARGTTVHGTAGNFEGVTFAHGASFGIRKSVHESVRGFDEAIRAGEEIDLALRLLQVGVAFHEAPDAVVHYRYRHDAASQWNQAFENGRIKPHVCRLLHATQHRGPGRLAGLRSWLWLVRTLPRLGDPVARIRWRWVLASRCGHIAGCFRYRTVYL